MNKVQVTAKRDFIKTLTTASPVAALEELIWNGFDASSECVSVFLDTNKLNGLETIRVRDYGFGINHSHLNSLFGNLGESWKRNVSKTSGRALHGKNGKGRFKSLALGSIVEWNTAYKDETGKIKTYKITGTSDEVDNFSISEPTEIDNDQTGTEVIITNLFPSSEALLSGKVRIELAKKFAIFLTEYPGLTLIHDGFKIDPVTVLSYQKDYSLDDIDLGNNSKVNVEITVIEWNIKTERHLSLCDAKGITLHDLPTGHQIRAPGFNYTAYIKTDLFKELDKQNQLILGEEHPLTNIIIDAAKGKIREHFRKRIAETQSKLVERWKEEQIYPYEDNADVGPVEFAERQVFDIIASNVENYLPTFEVSDYKSKKFTFRLLSQAIRTNPDTIQEIITEVLGLKKEDQDDLAELLRKTPLTSIISTAKIVANRLNFLVGLENLLFDQNTKKLLLERDQLHKILERESWIFHEEFTLSGSEQRLEEVLEKHLHHLGEREDNPKKVLLSDGKTGRIDLIFHKVVEARTGEYDYLIVELKRPSKKIDDEVITQIKKYARAIATDERFHGVPAKWTFVAISNEFDDFAKSEANQRGWPRGKVSDDAELNIAVWIKTWAEIINDARARLTFVNDYLVYEADRDSAKEYLQKAHSKFLPSSDEIIKKEEEKEERRKTKQLKKVSGSEKSIVENSDMTNL
jgi:hypothetical protein